MVIVAITVGFCFLILSLWLVRAVFNSLGNFIEVFSGLVVLFFPHSLVSSSKGRSWSSLSPPETLNPCPPLRRNSSISHDIALHLLFFPLNVSLFIFPRWLFLSSHFSRIEFFVADVEKLWMRRMRPHNTGCVILRFNVTSPSEWRQHNLFWWRCCIERSIIQLGFWDEPYSWILPFFCIWPMSFAHFFIPNLRRHALSVVPSLPLRQVACTRSLARTLILTVTVWRPLALGFVNGEGEHRAFSSWSLTCFD